jgi:hypothetical protein
VSFFRLVDPAEAAAGGAPRVPTAHALTHVLVGGQLEMRADLLVQLVVQSSSLPHCDELA